jgi:hypothetical protein
LPKGSDKTKATHQTTAGFSMQIPSSRHSVSRKDSIAQVRMSSGSKWRRQAISNSANQPPSIRLGTIKRAAEVEARAKQRPNKANPLENPGGHYSEGLLQARGGQLSKRDNKSSTPWPVKLSLRVLKASRTIIVYVMRLSAITSE